MESTVPAQSIMFMGIAALVCILIPLILLVYFKRRKNAELIAFASGCVVFVLFALFIEALINYGVSQSAFGKRLLSNIWLYGLYGGIMAGLFEETGRFIAFKTVLKKHRDNDANALMYGVGHGGIEAIVTVSITYLAYIVLAAMINAGMTSKLTEGLTVEQADTIQLLFSQLSDQPSWYFLIAILERCLGIAAHIGFSVLVWFAAKKKDRFILYPLAILLHAAMDFIAVIAATKLGLPVLAAEGVIAVCSLVTVIIAAVVWKRNTVAEKESC